MSRRAIDEDTFAVPAGWWEHIQPRRGGSLRPGQRVDPGAEALLSGKTRPLKRGGDPELAAALRAYRAGKVTPLGTAMAAHLMPLDSRIADAWVTRHGVAFAAEAAVEAGRIELGGVAVRKPDTAFSSLPADPLIARIRVLLARAKQRDYDAAVEALESHRADHLTRMIVSFLVPTREDWVDELCAAAVEWGSLKGSWRMLLCSLGTPEQLEQVASRKKLRDQIPPLDVLYTLADGIGPAIAPTVAALLDQRPRNRDLVNVLVNLPTDEAFDLLVSRLDAKYGPAAVAEATRRYPARALRRLAAGVATTSAAGPLLRTHIHDHPELVAKLLPGLPEDQQSVIEPLALGYGQLPEAPADVLPTLLLKPPWSSARRKASQVVVQGLVVPEHRAVKWLPGERAEWEAKLFGGVYPAYPSDDWATAVALYQADKLDWYEHVSLFTSGPENVVRPLLPKWRPSGQNARDAEFWGRPLVARYGIAALVPVLHLAKTKPAMMAELLMPLVSSEVAVLMADWLGRLKSTRPTAKAWLSRHAQWAARYLVPVALGPLGKRRSDAEAALMLIPAEARSAARRYGTAAEREIDDLLSVDPLEILPESLPVPGAWADPAALPPIMLRSREWTLPPAAVGHVITMLAMSRREAVYPGVSIVKDLCDPASLEEFSRALVDRWQEADRPGKDRWVLLALDLFSYVRH